MLYRGCTNTASKVTACQISVSGKPLFKEVKLILGGVQAGGPRSLGDGCQECLTKVRGRRRWIRIQPDGYEEASANDKTQDPTADFVAALGKRVSSPCRGLGERELVGGGILGESIKAAFQDAAVREGMSVAEQSSLMNWGTAGPCAS